ncbi:peptidase S28 [Panus rudis PR-1116 ss-1]|nr:peptidase S28 [Panus rudis PR-1116 ss-1]
MVGLLSLSPMFFPAIFGALVLLVPEVASKADINSVRLFGAQGVNLWKLEALRDANAILSQEPSLGFHSQAPFYDYERHGAAVSNLPPLRGHWFRQPIDHFANNSRTFRQRYWLNTRHYKPNTSAPVIVLDGGETSGEDRLPFLDTGIVDILAKATGGVGVVLEHRYYGRSIPVSNLSTDALRFLNNEQALADSANFIATVKFPGIDEDLTTPNTPWIYYGGSYAGARAAHMRILYPDLVYGAIASSAVTHASLSNWEYMEIIRRAANPRCSNHLEKAIQRIDTLLAIPFAKRTLKGLFGLADLEHDEDFASVIESPLGAWQAKNWDPAVGSTDFEQFCDALNKPLLGHDPEILIYDNITQMVTLPGGLRVDLSVYNYANYIKENVVSQCPPEFTVEDCFGTFDDKKFQETALEHDWRLWVFQVCTQWGYFSTAPPDPRRPRIVSKLLTLEYESKICKQAFPPGKYFQVPPMPNITAVNALGDFDIAADRLAFIDGEVDPWRPCTPHSEYARNRPDTILRPFKLIPHGVHHWDENGLRNTDDEPFDIRKIHAEEVDFVTAWLKDWKPPKQDH